MFDSVIAFGLHDVTLDSSGAVIERTVGLVGDVTVIKRSGGDVWSYPNIHGDTILTANASGGSTGTYWNDAFGQPIGSIADNSSGNYDYGWLGKQRRGVEHEAGLDIIEMGARQYAPALGRFLETDPIEGGSFNDYEYAGGDPVNSVDLAGTSKNTIRHRFEGVPLREGTTHGGSLGNYGWKHIVDRHVGHKRGKKKPSSWDDEGSAERDIRSALKSARYWRVSTRSRHLAIVDVHLGHGMSLRKVHILIDTRRLADGEIVGIKSARVDYMYPTWLTHVLEHPI